MSDSTQARVTPTGCRGYNGGGVDSDFEETVLEDCMFSGNAAGGNGGAISLRAPDRAPSGFGRARLVRVAATGCSGFDGGAVWVGNGQAEFTDCSFSDNVAAVHGGAIYSLSLDQGMSGGSSPRVRFAGVVLAKNRAGRGGGIYATGKIDFAEGTSIWGNTATEQGGGLDGGNRLTCVNGKPKTTSICGNAAPQGANCAGTTASGDCACDAAPCRTEACGKDRPCPTGFTCEKRGREKRCECASGVICGTACCAAGQICQGDACVTPTPPCAAKGQTCGQDSGRECCAGLTCGGQLGAEPTCRVPAGGPCQASADCAFGSICKDGRCVDQIQPACRPSVQPGDNAGLKRAIEDGGTVTLGTGTWTLTATSVGIVQGAGASVSKTTRIVACPDTRPVIQCSAAAGSFGVCFGVEISGWLQLEGISIQGVGSPTPVYGITVDDPFQDDQQTRLSMSASTVSGFVYGVQYLGNFVPPIACAAGTGNAVCSNTTQNCTDISQAPLDFPGCGCCPS